MADNSPTLHLSTSPHIRHHESVPAIMGWVCIALVPAHISAVLVFGFRTVVVTAVAIAAAMGTEYLVNRLQKKPATLGDFSAVVTGILVSFNLPSDIPLWMAALGSIFGIGVAKMVFGGLGHNFINPALAGRAFLTACYPAAMTVFPAPKTGFIDGIDGLSGATPLAHIKDIIATDSLQILDLQTALPNCILGNIGGCIGETSAIALLLGAILLWYKRIIGFSIPATYIATVFLLFWIFNGSGLSIMMTSEGLLVPLYHIFSGGLMLGALFMATDMVTSPITPSAKLCFGIGCGVLTFIIRKFGGYPEGVSYSILLMNIVAPLLDRLMKPRLYGALKRSE